MNNNTIDIEIIPKVSRKNRTLNFSFKLKINDQPINENHILDIYGLVNLVVRKEALSIYLWNCECGYPECAGIESITIKTKNNDDLTLFVPIPCSSKDYEDKNYQYWKLNHQVKTLKINRNDMAKKVWDLTLEIEKIMTRLTKKLQLAEWPAHTIYYEYTWPQNMPVDIRNELLKVGYSFND
jgi:hypothetical protein